MSTTVEARRLNGTDLGKTIDNYGVIQSVKHAEESFKSRLIGYAEETLVETKVVEIRTSRGQFILHPAAKITITGKPSPKEASNV